MFAVDGTNLTHRAWHATGGSVEATHNLVLSWVSGCVSTSGAGVIAFDGVNAGHWRYRILPGYKGGRKDKDPELVRALSRASDVFSSAGWTCVTYDELEADDVLASVCAAHEQVDVVTSDKDAFALVKDPGHQLLRPENSSWRRYDEAQVLAATGVAPGAWQLFCAVKGDSSDKIPGVRGLGQVAALAIASEFSTVEEWLADLSSGGARCAQALGEKPTARLLARLPEVTEQARDAQNVLRFAPRDDVRLGPPGASRVSYT